ncbi:DMT family transporter [Clostridium hydrogeniformans]|uniref:DMT family transporter n=1 Tax=Clostridium hydrogeniformans TaxID=349933 RepID=UPI00047F3BEB|nr:DMT family transporter [Clostridium hydrogeniformans]
MVNVLLAVLAGASIVIARIINANLANRIGLFQGTFFNYITGLTVSFLFLLISKEQLFLSSSTLSSIPSLAYLGGIVGVMVVGMSSFINHKISAFYLTLIIFIGQLFSGIIIDYYTLGSLSLGKILGGSLVVLGLVYNLKVDSNVEEA